MKVRASRAMCGIQDVKSPSNARVGEAKCGLECSRRAGSVVERALKQWKMPDLTVWLCGKTCIVWIFVRQALNTLGIQV